MLVWYYSENMRVDGGHCQREDTVRGRILLEGKRENFWRTEEVSILKIEGTIID